MGVFLRLKALSTKSWARYLLKGLGLYLGCLLFMMLTNPSKTSLAALLVPFFLFGLGTFMFISLGTMVIFRGVRVRIRRFVALTISSTLVLMLLLRSLNQFTVKDGLIIFVLIGCLSLYVVRADFLGKISSNRDKPSV